MLSTILAVSGCDPAASPPSGAAAVTSAPTGSAILSVQTETLPPDALSTLADPVPDGAYALGPDDIISITVYLHPDLSVPQPNSSNGGGALITSDGTVALPLIGNVKLGGLTLPQAEAALANDYAPYCRDPKVAIELQQAQSLRYYLLGAFSAPGIKFPVHRLTLLEALALGGSVDFAGADLHQAYVAQGNTKLPIDLYELLTNGDLSQNITLASGDAIVVPSSASENAFIFGAIGRPGPVQFQSGALSLLQALASAGMDLTSYTDAELSQIHIIRGGGRSAEFLVVDARLILEDRAQPFALQPGDIVFVPPNGLATWNQVLTQLLPSLQTVSATLNPFVSIKYLDR
jgi:polysaccharide export outer membrane protein